MEQFKALNIWSNRLVMLLEKDLAHQGISQEHQISKTVSSGNSARTGKWSQHVIHRERKGGILQKETFHLLKEGRKRKN